MFLREISDRRKTLKARFVLVALPTSSRNRRSGLNRKSRANLTFKGAQNRWSKAILTFKGAQNRRSRANLMFKSYPKPSVQS